MAENGVITIKFVEGGSSTPGPQPINQEISGEKPVKEDISSKNNILQTAVMVTMIQKAYQQVKNMGVSEVKYQINRYFTLTDDYRGQQTMNIALGVINKCVGIGTSVMGGIVTGSAVGGPLGALAGASIAAGVSLISLGQEVYHNYDQEDIQIRKMDASLQFNRQRAGYSLTAGTRGENR